MAHLKELELDVREDQREHREPFRAIMDAVQSLGPDQDLVLISAFEPVPLYRVLGRSGFTHEAEEIGPDHWRVRFTKAAAGAAT